MTTLYKLTDKNGQTYNGTQWGPGISHSGTGEGDLCGPGWIHAYTDPLLAVLLNPIHAKFPHPRLWEAEGEVAKTDCGLKVGCKTLTTLREIPLPEITTEQRVRFAIGCVKANPGPWRGEAEWTRWADRWLSGEDRTAVSAGAAWAATRAGSDAARAAWAEAWAAEAAAWAAAEASATSAWAAAEAAAEAAWAAADAAATDDIDLIAIAHEAVSA